MSFKTMRAAAIKAGGKVSVKVTGEDGGSMTLRIDGGLTAHTPAGIVAAAKNGCKFNTKFVESVNDDGESVTATHSGEFTGKVAMSELRDVLGVKADKKTNAENTEPANV